MGERLARAFTKVSGKSARYESIVNEGYCSQWRLAANTEICSCGVYLRGIKDGEFVAVIRLIISRKYHFMGIQSLRLVDIWSAVRFT